MEQKRFRASLQKVWYYFSLTYDVVWNVILILLIATLCLVCFAVGIGAGYFAFLVKDMEVPSHDQLKNEIYSYEETSHMYFADGIYLGQFRSDLDRESVRLADVSPYVVQAVIATEDEHFYEHDGVVPKAVIRAIFQEVTNSPIKSGGSTLTQQLVKNQLLTSEVSFERKAKEMLLAMRLERFFSKEEILEAYLNVVPFGRSSSGRNIAGIQAAAQGVFGVDAKELNLAQAAFLAGLPQNPFVYTPFTADGSRKQDISAGLERMKTVLYRMKRAGYISDKQYKEALAYDVTKHFAAPKPTPFERYPFLTMEIERRAKDVLAETFAKRDGHKPEELKRDAALYSRYVGEAEKMLRQGGLHIHTTIDKAIYEQMQRVAANYPYYGNERLYYVTDTKTGKRIAKRQPVEVGAMLIENKTGKIISFVGGRDYKREQLNHATQAYRSNGSTMKPLLVYAPAMEMGVIQPGSIIPDLPLSIGSYKPKNADGKTHGLVTARRALQHSYNIPAVRVYTKIQNRHPVDYLHKMGITSVAKEEEKHPALAIGGTNIGVTVEENVNAYATFANYGSFVDAYMIEKITDKDGKVIYQHTSKPVRVFSPQTSYLMIDMMRDVLRGGTASSVRRYLTFSADWAGKTGTSQDNRDSWFVATNPNVTFGVWIGYDRPASLESRYKGFSYGQRTQLLWAQLMNAAHRVKPKLINPSERFLMPGGIVRRAYCATSGFSPSSACKKAGLVRYDLYNTKFTPRQGSDDYLIEGRVVVIGEHRYAALETTPEEFVTREVVVNPKLLDQWGINRKTSVGDAFVVSTLKDNGRVPAPPAARLNDNQLVWARHGERDVIGYRVYQVSETGKRQIVAIIKAGETTSFSDLKPGATYYVTAVDIAGRESAPSSKVALPAAQSSPPANSPASADNAENSEAPPSSSR
ncbi:MULTISPECIES: transglycosylase domain-containing protein [Geobacillus]|jgi:penicillin-binding protein 1B|uniref:Penicillin-binding protein-like protein n=2 Tax=Geobacillus thermodenitrificans TaxID=33940 RepID=A4IRV1_GEOTN|nr:MULTISPECIES: transglycosylase domain-containing protein [Geobacillus]ABO68055.1 penicillin-binding protein-like protein [Geobacillus thermodenitrificans NG80-2]ARA98788.1 peptidoglycan glycosyltransferase [Geobacillus thermodenitrificans]KQB92253.1 peptidoglycan glycosyltransferase [Geobacillus sp. PA-3]MED3719055.1 transglycosylase domain-containing protein [Geobacillus thermodenitrificans]MED3905720.1 transglycosylase domain-containing protein [Geobacillus thermodenitrificans]